MDDEDTYDFIDDNKPYEITKVNQFSKKIAKVIAKQIYMSMSELKSSITVKNIKGIIYEHCDLSEEGYPILTAKKLDTICEDIFSWLAGVRLAKDAAADKVDCYWNNEKNCMIFRWKDKSKED
tara:strand:+ start:1050 stop:1418 length:369 start_codon:yes stop_codon:yes gene_type:complete